MKHWFNSVTIVFIHTKHQFYLIKKRKPNSTIAATNYRKISNVVRCLTRCDTKENTSRICHLNIIIIIIITSSDDIQPSTLLSNQSPSGLIL